MKALLSQEVSFLNGDYYVRTHNRQGDVILEWAAEDSPYRLPFLEEEAGEDGSFVVRSYVIPNEDSDVYEEALQAIWKDLKHFGTTLAWVTKDGSFTAVSVRQGNLVPLPWGQMKTFEIHMGPKFDKRLSALNMWSYLNGRYRARRTDEITPHDINNLSYIILPVEEEQEALVDGEIYIRRELYNDMIGNVYAQLMMSEDEKAHEKAEFLRDRFNATRVLIIRIITPDGFFKGHAVVCDSLPADIVVHDPNLKKEIVGTSPDEILISALHEKQNGSVRTNRQSVGHFYDWLFAVPTPGREDSDGLVKDALKDMFDEYIELFQQGQLLPFVQPAARDVEDPAGNIYSKMVAAVNAGRSLNEFLWLQMMAAGQVVNMYTPRNEREEQQKRTRYPAPYATSYALKSASTYYMATSDDSVDLSYGEAFILPDLGLIVNDDTFIDMAPVLGGADKDDKVEIHYRQTPVTHEFMGIKFNAGDVVLFVLRNPIDVNSDGKVVGSAYYLLRPTAEEAERILEEYGELPELDLENRPICTAEMDFPPAQFAASGRETPDSYTKHYLVENVEAASRTQGVYGTHSNLMLQNRIYDIPFEHVAPETEFIDACAQTRNPDDLLFIKNLNHHQQQLLDIAIERLPMEDIEAMNPIPDLIDYHTLQLQRFIVAARDHLRQVKSDLAEKYAAFASDEVPVIITWVENEIDSYCTEHSMRKSALRDRHRTEIGNRVLDYINNRITDPTDPLTRTATLRLMRDAYRWTWTQVKPSIRQAPSLRDMFYDTEQRIAQGPLFVKILLTAMEAYL